MNRTSSIGPWPFQNFTTQFIIVELKTQRTPSPKNQHHTPLQENLSETEAYQKKRCGGAPFAWDLPTQNLFPSSKWNLHQRKTKFSKTSVFNKNFEFIASLDK